MEEGIAGRFEKARVKHVVVHKKEPIALVVLYSGEFEMWNTIGMSLIKTGSIGEIPIRAAAFIEDRESFAIGGDDGILRIYCIDTFKLKHKVQAHTDFIRNISVHPILPYMATCSDDMQIKIWDYSKEISLIKTLSGHTHFVMAMDFSTKDSKLLLSCSLDHNIIVWNIETGAAVRTLKGTQTALNTIKYIGDKFIISGGDDGKINVWDASTYALITSVLGHMGPVTSIYCTGRGFISAGEDGLVREWDKKRFRPETSTSARVQRIWSVCCVQSGDILAGGDEGISFIKQMKSPVMHNFIPMEKEGRIVISENTNLVQIKTSNPSAAKKITTLSYVPDRVGLSGNGRYLAVESDGMVYVYTVLGFLLQVSVPGSSLVWTGPEEFLILYSGGIVKYADFEVDGKVQINPPMEESEEMKTMKKVDDDHIFVRTETAGYLISHLGKVVLKKADVESIYKYGSKYVLIYRNKIEVMVGETDESPVSYSCRVNSWCAKKNVVFIHTGSKVIYFVMSNDGKKHELYPVTIDSLGGNGVLLGVTESLWALDGGKVFDFKIEWELVEYQSKIISGEVPQTIPKKYAKECIHFLMGMNMLEDAYKLADDPDEKFELLIKLGKLKEAVEISDTEAKYSRLCSLFVKSGKILDALECAKKGVSVENEILLASLCDRMDDLKNAAVKAYDQGKTLVALAAGYRSENIEMCRKIFQDTEFEKLFNRTHGPKETK
ncbi:coatomer subunit beta' [Nematocida minor]|uniref:coatomer subunit beta' n=1 Tax=Nematocida minor TaxID=1912983 RepID=UPI0022211B50|nr:coatomer subunit beta' [Nematocida minor]KAI5189125.1 coatomer subunit beta' [Nematocida minor]